MKIFTILFLLKIINFYSLFATYSFGQTINAKFVNIPFVATASKFGYNTMCHLANVRTSTVSCKDLFISKNTKLSILINQINTKTHHATSHFGMYYSLLHKRCVENCFHQYRFRIKPLHHRTTFFETLPQIIISNQMACNQKSINDLLPT